MGIPVAVAILVGLVSSFIQSLGLTIQRKSHVQEDSLPLETRRGPIRRPLWIIGFGIYITSNVFSSIFQLDALPIVILAPLGAVSLIFNALLARIILGDHFGTQSIVGTALVALGAVLIAVFGVVQEDEHGLDELLKLWKRGPFIAFFSVLCVAVAAVLVSAHLAVWHAQRHHSGIVLDDEPAAIASPAPSNYASPQSQAAIPFRPTDNHRSWSSPVVLADAEPGVKAPSPSGVRFALKPAPTLSSEPTQMFDAQQRTLTLAGLAFAAASGTLAGMTLVLAKAAVELLVITIDYWRTGHGTNEFARTQTWFLVSGLGIGAILQLVYLNYSLAFASPALICPLAFCFFNLSSIFDGLMFYDQIGRLQHYQIALVTVGVAILLLGVWVVSMIQSTGEGGVEVGTWVEEDSEEDELEAAEGATLLGGEATTEPTVMEDAPALTRIRAGWPGSPIASSPPGSPLSPTGRRRRSRYGSIVLDHTHHAPPPGFSIGIGAASPGFTLRPESNNTNGFGVREHRRSRTESEGQAGVLQTIQGIGLSEGQQDPEETLRSWAQEQRAEEDRRAGWWRRLINAGQQQGRIHLQEEDHDRQ